MPQRASTVPIESKAWLDAEGDEAAFRRDLLTAVALVPLDTLRVVAVTLEADLRARCVRGLGVGLGAALGIAPLMEVDDDVHDGPVLFSEMTGDPEES